MQPVTLNQTLHGYKDGHRAIASSIVLSAQDTKTLLVLSDISGPGSRLESQGYLTGYPLPSSGLYALARTWPAPEMSRPGCVWTHTLLIDFADLATIVDPTHLLELFRKPDQPTPEAYKKTILFNEDLQTPPKANFQIASFAKPLLAALYQYPSKPIISFHLDPIVSEMAVLALWAQQWPRLRRSFRFCTMASADRSTKDALFDLQILPKAMLSARSRFINAIDANTPDREPPWLSAAVEDLAIAKPDGLRQFLFHAGSDLQNGRSSFATLCNIFSLIEGVPESQVDIEAALKLIPDPSEPSTARALKGIVVGRLFNQHSDLSRTTLSYMVDHLDLLDRRYLDEDTNRFGQSLLRDQPKLFLKMSQTGTVGEEIFLKTLASVSINDILKAAKRVSGLLSAALELRSELLRSPSIWALIDDTDKKTFEMLNELEFSQDVLCAAILSKRFDLVDSFLHQSNPSKLLTALHQVYANNELTAENLRQWLKTIGKPSDLGSFFSSTDAVDRRFIFEVSQFCSPKEIPSNPNIDPWLSAIEGSKNNLSEGDELFLRAYLLARALDDDIHNAAELAKFGFEITDAALANSRLPITCWNQLEPKLPWPMFWQDWDKCYRLRKGLVDRCVEEKWPVEVFAKLTSVDETFAILVTIADESYRGRQYLEAVMDILKHDRDPVLKKRRATIKQILKSY